MKIDRASPGTRHNPGDAHKRNFQHNPRGKFHVKSKRGAHSRSKSSVRSMRNS
jgi:hypothetical protein